MFYPLDSRNTKNLKKQKLKCFYKQQSYFSQIVSKKKAKITISFFMKNSRNSNIILGFSFQFYVFGFSLSNEQNKTYQIVSSKFRFFTDSQFFKDLEGIKDDKTPNNGPSYDTQKSDQLLSKQYPRGYCLSSPKNTSFFEVGVIFNVGLI